MRGWTLIALVGWAAWAVGCGRIGDDVEPAGDAATDVSISSGGSGGGATGGGGSGGTGAAGQGGAGAGYGGVGGGYGDVVDANSDDGRATDLADTSIDADADGASQLDVAGRDADTDVAPDISLDGGCQPSESGSTPQLNALGAKSLAFAAGTGALHPPSQYLQMWASGGTIEWVASADAAWLNLSVTSGVANANASLDPWVSVNATGLPAGVYSATVTFSPTAVCFTPLRIPVTLRVVDAGVAWTARPPQTMTHGQTYSAQYQVSGVTPNQHWLVCNGIGIYWYPCFASDELRGTVSQYGNGIFDTTLPWTTYCAASTEHIRVASRVRVGESTPIDATPDAGGDWVTIYSDEMDSELFAGPAELDSWPRSFLFVGTAGGVAKPSAQDLWFSERCSRIIPWTTTTDVTWLALSPSAGDTSWQFYASTVSVDTTSLPLGDHFATITATSADSGSGPVTMPVRLKVVPAAVHWTIPPPTSLSTGVEYAVQYQVTNAPGSVHRVECNGAQLCTAAPGVGDGLFDAKVGWFSCATTWQSARVAVTLCDGGASDAGAVDADAGGGECVTLYSDTFTPTVLPSPVNLRPSPATMSFTAALGVDGGWDLAPQTVRLAESCSNPITWSASPDAAWLHVSPASAAGGATATVSVDGSGLAAGHYSATITFAATSLDGGSSSTTVPVTLDLQ